MKVYEASARCHHKFVKFEAYQGRLLSLSCAAAEGTMGNVCGDLHAKDVYRLWVILFEHVSTKLSL